MTCRWHPFAWLSALVFPLAVPTACSREAVEEAPRAPAAVVGDELLLASAKVALPPSGIAAADLPQPNSEGARLVVAYCVRCHALPTPTIHSATDWPSVLRRMWLRADRVAPAFNVPVPTTAERITILRYMLDNALRVSGAALPAGPGRETFSTTCSRCHELPDPRQHSAADWAAVVIRMRGHMQEMLGLSLGREEMTQIILYLERASRAAS